MATIDYELVLNRLFGENAVTKLREFVKKGDIEGVQVCTVMHCTVLYCTILYCIDGVQVSSIAERVNASVPYQEYRSNGVVVAFDKVLKYWVNEKLYNYQPEQAKHLLLDVLTKAGCSNRIVDTIKSMIIHNIGLAPNTSGSIYGRNFRRQINA